VVGHVKLHDSIECESAQVGYIGSISRATHYLG